MNTAPMPGSPGRATLQSTTGRIAAVATALLLVLFIVLSVSRAAFVADTTNPGNAVDTDGVVWLTDDDADSALFTSAKLLPLDVTLPLELDLLNASAKCIHVRYDGNFTSDTIQMFATPVGAAVDLGPLADYLDVTVVMQELPNPDLANGFLVPNPLHLCTAFDAADLADAGNPTPIYSGELDEFGGDYATGQATFAGEESTYAFKVTINVQDNPAAVDKAAAWNFVWEAQTTP